MKLTFLFILVLLSSCAKDYRFKKTISDEKMKLCFIGDTGTKKEVQYKVAALLATEKCHSIHFLGDIIYPHGLTSSLDPQFREKFFDLYGPIANRDHNPRLFMIMGNHDHRRSISHWVELSKKHPEIFFPNAYYLLQLNNNVCLVHLDTDYYKLLANLFTGLAQSKWLDQQRDILKDCKVKVALTHHPYNNSGKSHGPSSGWVRHFLKDNIIGKFDYLISGHEHHLSDEGIEKGTRLLISGAGGNTEKLKDGGYLVFEIEKDQVDYKFRRLTE